LETHDDRQAELDQLGTTLIDARPPGSWAVLRVWGQRKAVLMASITIEPGDQRRLAVLDAIETRFPPDRVATRPRCGARRSAAGSHRVGLRTSVAAR